MGDIMVNEKRRKQAGFSKEERDAMKERVMETKGENGEDAVLAKIAEMPASDKKMALQLHKLIKSAAPELKARTWYGMPAYAKGGKIICFFQNASKFKTRYATLGFSDSAKLDDGKIWPVSYALKEFDDKTAAKIAKLVKEAVG